MPFDINPLGNTFYLQQLEREVSQLKAIEQATLQDKAGATARSAGLKAWFGLAVRSLWSRATA